MNIPAVTRVYKNHHLDSTRWESYTPRDDDIIVTTSYKSGTTFTQQILYNMLVRDTQHDDELPEINAISPWVDARFWGITKEDLVPLLEGIKHRRFLKSHLPLYGLPYYEQVKYLIIGRDVRDVFMSMVNHYSNYTDLSYAVLEQDNPGLPFPRYDGDIKAFWKNWITRGWFEWEQEGYPMWANMQHTQSYWEYRHLPNFLFLHYADMRADLPAAVKRIADFIEHDLSEDEISAIVSATDFENVRKKAVAKAKQLEGQPQFFNGGDATFFFKGNNGRWKDVLDEEDLCMYEETKSKVLSEDCAAWLEQGDAALES
ncbi:MAG: sulfotransferase [Gammaproteobacteria bacterium]|nr:sulfotransferase [Gammaproteobacteria bacterium]